MSDPIDMTELEAWLLQNDKYVNEYNQLQAKQLDYTILYVAQDEATAWQVQEALEQAGAIGYLYDDDTWQNYKLDSVDARNEDLWARSNYILVITSNNWADNKTANAVRRLKEVLLEQSINFDRRNVIPLFLTPREDTTEEARANLWGLMAYNGLNITEDVTERALEKVLKLFNKDVSRQRLEGRAEKQKKKLDEFIEEKYQEMEKSKELEARAKARAEERRAEEAMVC